VSDIPAERCGEPDPARTPGRHLVLLCAATAALLIEGWSGIRWGLPSPERSRLVIPGDPAPVLRRVLEQTARDIEQKRATSVLVPLPGSSRVEPERSLAEDEVALARATRRFLTFSCDWDEPHIIRSLAMMRPDAFDFNPRMFSYGGLAIYPVGALIRAGMALGLMPRRATAEAFLADPEAFGRLYVAGRLWVLLLVVIGLWTVWWAATQAHGPAIGLVAALLYATSTPVHAWMTLIKPHTPVAAFVALAYGFAVRAVVRARPSDLVRAAVAAGLAASMVQTATITFLVVLVAAWRFEGTLRGRAMRAVRLALVTAAVFVALNPYYLLDFDAVRAEKQRHGEQLAFRLEPASFVALARWQLANAIPLPLLVLALGGACVRQRPPRLVAASLVAVNYLAVSSGVSGMAEPTMVRWLLPSLPILAIWAALGHARLRARFPVLACVLIVAGASWSLLLDLFYQRDRLVACTAEASHQQAGGWLAAALPRGTDLGLVYEPVPRQLPPIDLARYRLRWIPHPWTLRAGLPEWFLTTTATPPAPGYAVVARFLDDAGLVSLSPVPPPRAGRRLLYYDASEHQVAFAGVHLGYPLQLHQIPFYLHRRTSSPPPPAAR
jgi:hypothetical protein